MILEKPKTKDYGEYYEPYISLVNHSDPIWQLKANLKQTSQFLKDLQATKWDYSYAEGKWTVKEMIQHIIDTERIMSTRALRISRGENQDMTGFDHNLYVKNSNANRKTALDLIDEYHAVRNSSLILFRCMCEDDLDRIGTASNKTNFSPRSIAFIIAGHEIHHLNILKSRYFTEDN